MNARDRPPRHRLRPAGDTRHRPAVDRALCADVCGVGAGMSYRVKRPSRRSVRNVLEFMAGGTAIEQAPAPRVRKPRAQREAGANDALKEWRKYRPDVRIWRNNVGEYKTDKYYIRYGLCPGSADFIGLRSITITPGMVGKKVAVFLAIESKAPNKDAEDHQETWLTEVRDAGAIAGVARNAQEAEDMLTAWITRMVGDER